MEKDPLTWYLSIKDKKFAEGYLQANKKRFCYSLTWFTIYN